MLFARCRCEALTNLDKAKSNELCKGVRNLAPLDALVEQVHSRARVNENKECYELRDGGKFSVHMHVWITIALFDNLLIFFVHL